MTGVRAARTREVAALLASLLLLAGASFSAAATQESLHVALLIDTSGSIRKADQAVRNRMAAEIAKSLPSGSDIAVYRFDDQPKLIVPRTGNADEVAQATASLGAGGRFTALNDAIFDAARYLAEGPAGKRAIVVLTDGLDENSALVAEDGINEARERRIPIFCVGVGNVQERYLRRIAKLSGAEYFGPRANAAGIVERVAELTPVSETRLAAGPAAPAGAPLAAAVRPSVAAPVGPSAPTWPILAGIAFAVLIALSALGFVLLRKTEPAPASAHRPSPAASGGSGAAAEFEDPEDVTLVGRMQDLQAEGSTLVLRLKPLLHVTKGPNFGKFFEINVESASSIGRAKGNDIALDDHAVSSQHCRIRPLGGVYELIDMKSTNGTFVNERKVTRTNLSAGDVIKLGETSMQFRMDHMKG